MKPKICEPSWNFPMAFIKGVGNKELIERILKLDSKHRKLVFDLLVCIESDHKIKS